LRATLIVIVIMLYRLAMLTLCALAVTATGQIAHAAQSNPAAPAASPAADGAPPAADPKATE